MQLGVISSRTGKGDNKSEVPVTSKEQRFSSSLSQSFKDDVVGNSSCWWADTVATHCPSRPSQLLVNNHSKTLRQSGWKPLYYVAEQQELSQIRRSLKRRWSRTFGRRGRRWGGWVCAWSGPWSGRCSSPAASRGSSSRPQSRSPPRPTWLQSVRGWNGGETKKYSLMIH